MAGLTRDEGEAVDITVSVEDATEERMNKAKLAAVTERLSLDLDGTNDSI